ncbi:tetratricopeptide repeat protein [Candidatus Gracilibacteria bacterium]|nr:tetratricopeptide repeat protein [Candidatus Gracilibacteria bacterium]
MNAFWLSLASVSWLAIGVTVARRLYLYYRGVRLPLHEEFGVPDQIAEQTINLERMFQNSLHDMSFSELIKIADKIGQKKDYKKVVKYLEEALKRDLPPDHYVDVHMRLVEAYLALLDFPRALVVVNKLIFHFPDSIEWYEQAAKIQMLAGKYEEAVKTLEILIDRAPKKEYIELLARAYRRLKLHDKARAIYQDVHRLR